MTKAEYLIALYYCHVKCEPEDDKCKNCEILKAYKEIYGDKEIKL